MKLDGGSRNSHARFWLDRGAKWSFWLHRPDPCWCRVNEYAGGRVARIFRAFRKTPPHDCLAEPTPKRSRAAYGSSNVRCTTVMMSFSYELLSLLPSHDVSVEFGGLTLMTPMLASQSLPISASLAARTIR